MDGEIENKLPAGWTKTSIGEVTLSVQKVDPLDNPEREIEYIDISSIDNVRNVVGDAKHLRLRDAPSRARQIIRAGDVLFAMVRPYLRNIAAVPPKYDGQIASTGFSVLRPANGIEPTFLFYKSVSADFVNALSVEQYGVSYPAVTDDQVREQAILIPPYNEQCRIVAKIEAIISELNNGIESLKTAREQLKVYRQTILKHAFEGKLTAHWRAENSSSLETGSQFVARSEKAGEARTRPQKDLETITDSELQGFPSLPLGWSYSRFGVFIGDIQAGKSFKCDEREPRDNEVGIAKVSAVTWGEYDEKESKTCIDLGKVNPRLFIREGDFLFSRANTIELVGACVIVRATNKNIMLSDKTLRIVFRSGCKGYFLQYLRSQAGRNEIMKRSTGNQESMRNIGQNRIRSMIVPVCSEAEMIEITKKLSEHFTRIEALESAIHNELARSEALRQSVLKDALAGKLIAQDPNDEPASVVLERIRSDKVGIENGKQRIRRKDAA